jgi:hypothetical protein
MKLYGLPTLWQPLLPALERLAPRNSLQLA